MGTKKRKIISAAITSINVVALGGAATLAALELRTNNTTSGELYQRVQSADEANAGIAEALSALQLHVATHMNASPLPQLGDNAPVQLSRSYERAKAAEVARVTAERERVTKEGIAVCEAQFGTSQLTVRSQCIADYGAAHPVQPEREIIADLYRYDFVSPIWTPDKAGWLVLVAIVLAASLVLRIVSKVLATFLIKN
jgi:hypothetical protein